MCVGIRCNAGMFKKLKFVKIEPNQVDVCTVIMISHSTGVPQGSVLVLLLTCTMHFLCKRPFFKFKKCHAKYKNYDVFSHQHIISHNVYAMQSLGRILTSILTAILG